MKQKIFQWNKIYFLGNFVLWKKFFFWSKKIFAQGGTVEKSGPKKNHEKKDFPNLRLTRRRLSPFRPHLEWKKNRFFGRLKDAFFWQQKSGALELLEENARGELGKIMEKTQNPQNFKKRKTNA